MSYLLYGLDTYRSRQKLNAIKSKYIDASLGDTNLATLDGATVKPDELIRQIGAAPFLAPKRLVIIYNLVTQGNKETQKAIMDFLPKIPATSVVIFYEEDSPDKRNALFQALNLPKKTEEFTSLLPPKLALWIKNELKTTNTQITPDALQLLIQITGPDLWRLSQEIAKLSLHSPEKITRQDIETLVHQEPTGDIFQLLDALGARHAPKALSHIHALLTSGESPLYILSMIVYGFRTLILVEDYLRENPHRTSAPNVHPFVFRKSQGQLKHFSRAKLRQIYQKLSDLDYACKTGTIEPKLALDLFVAELTCGSLKKDELHL